MPPPELHPNTIRLMRRMTGVLSIRDRLPGEAIDPALIDELALGDLWALANATERYVDHRPVPGPAAETARMVLDLGRDREPVFRGAACRDYLDVVARDAEKKPEADPFGFGARWPLEHACFALVRCIDLSFPGLGPAAARVLAATHWRAMPHLAVALARLVDTDSEARVLDKLAVDFAGSPLLVDELRVAAELDLAETIALADVAYSHPAHPATGDAALRLFGLSRYAAFARPILTRAAECVRRVHAGERPYAADKAFTLEESAVVARLARVALDRDEPWIPEVLGDLFRKASLAPTAARTVPSQSVSIALGHAIEALPTPETVAILREVVRAVRHAGVAKKLQRNLRGAERGLAARPRIALRLPPDRPLTKTQLGAVARCLEAGFETGLTFPFDEWRARLAEHKQARGLTGALVWRILHASGATAVLPVIDRAGLALHDVRGAVVAADAGHRVALWHPAEADGAERKAWRDRIVASRISQPFKQVFREHYALPPGVLSQCETTLFSGHAVSIRPFLGLARRQGWRLEYDCLARIVGDVKVTLVLADRVFPGALGWTTISKIGVWRPGTRKDGPARLGDLSAVARSEVLRSVDLLVSTSGFALASTDADAPDDPRRALHLRALADRPLGPMAAMRRATLERVLAGRDGMADLTFDARHLRLGRYAIHLATGRVTRDGDPVTIDLQERSEIAAVPWLPYDERLLEVIAVTALHIGCRAIQPPPDRSR